MSSNYEKLLVMNFKLEAKLLRLGQIITSIGRSCGSNAGSLLVFFIGSEILTVNLRDHISRQLGRK
jgi:hypothetical protein